MLAVVLSIWLLGSTEAWSYSMVTVVALAGLVVWLVSLMTQDEPSCCSPRLTLWLIALTVFVAMQSVPLPRSIVNFLSPQGARETAESRAILSQVAGYDDSLETLPLSMAPAATQRSLYLLIAYLAVFLVTANSVRHWEHAKTLGNVVVASGFVMAILSVSHKFTGSDEIFWFYSPPHGGTVFGPFSNRNHFAAYMNMILGLALGLFMASIAGHRTGGDDMPLKERLLHFSTKRSSRLALLAFAIVVVGGAVAVSLSRAGLISLVAALAVLQFLAIRHGRGRASRWILGGVAILLIIGIAWLGWAPVSRRLGTLMALMNDPLNNSRALATLCTLDIYGSFPFTGCGFGAFKHVFPMHQAQALQNWRWLHAHNDWVQLLAEGGLAGMVIILMTVLSLVRCVVGTWKTSPRRAQALAGGIMVGVLAMAIHSLFDYSLHKPANAVLLAFLCGLAVSVTHLADEKQPCSEGGQDQPAAQTKARGVLLRSLRRIVLLGFIVIATVAMAFTSSVFSYGIQERRVMSLAQLLEQTEGRAEKDIIAGALSNQAEAAMRTATPTAEEAQAMTALLFNATMDQTLSLSSRLALSERALAFASLAALVAPADSTSWLWLARVKALVNQWDEAELCLARAKALRPWHAKVRMFGSQRSNTP